MNKIKSIALRAGFIAVLVLEPMASFFAPRAYALNITRPEDIGPQILCPIAIAMFWILIALSTVMVLYAAFLYLTARGEEDTVSKAHRTMTYAAVAVIVALVAKGFPAAVAGFIGQSNITGCQ